MTQISSNLRVEKGDHRLRFGRSALTVSSPEKQLKPEFYRFQYANPSVLVFPGTS